MDEIEWKNLADDDFIASKYDYKLRVEQMDDDVWWWEVYYKGRPLMGHCSYQPETEELAKAFAEMVYLAHNMALKENL